MTVLSLSAPACLVAVLLAAAACPAEGFLVPSGRSSLLQHQKQHHAGCGPRPRTGGAAAPAADDAAGKAARGGRSYASSPSSLSASGAYVLASSCAPLCIGS